MTRKLLILTATPKKLYPLRLGTEVRDIREGLKLSNNSNKFLIVDECAVRKRDLYRAVMKETPQMVHFAGHGEGEAGLYLEDKEGNPELVSGEALASLFSLITQKTQIECVVLNGCYSSVQAKAIAQYVPHVVGMQQAVGDQSAIEFAVGFYDAIWNGESVKFAFELGKVAMEFDGANHTGGPVLLSGRSSLTPEKIDKDKSTTAAKTNSYLQKNILLLSANPQKENLRREREVSEIEKAIIRSSLALLEGGESLPAFKQPLNRTDLTADQISKVLSTVKPFIVDISGDEDGLANLLLEESCKLNESKELNTLIGEVFQITSDSTQCIILNGCYLEKQAREILQVIAQPVRNKERPERAL